MKSCLVFLVIGVVCLWVWWPCELYRQFDSPSGAHRLLVYRYSMPLMFPGQSGDAPGKVLLQNSAGQTLQECCVEMVQNVESPEWTEHSVYVKLLLDWSF